MASIENIGLDLSVIVGEAEMPLQRLLELGRGAVIPLNGDDRKPLDVRINGRSLFEGRVVLQGDEVAVEIAGPANR